MAMKSKRGACKRLRVTGSGRIKHKKQGLRHILTKKTTKRKRHLRKHKVLHATEEPKARRLVLA